MQEFEILCPLGINQLFYCFLPNITATLGGKCFKKVTIGHGNIKIRATAHKIGVFWALFHVFYSVLPQRYNFLIWL